MWPSRKSKRKEQASDSQTGLPPLVTQGKPNALPPLSTSSRDPLASNSREAATFLTAGLGRHSASSSTAGHTPGPCSRSASVGALPAASSEGPERWGAASRAVQFMGAAMSSWTKPRRRERPGVRSSLLDPLERLEPLNNRAPLSPTLGKKDEWLSRPCAAALGSSQSSICKNDPFAPATGSSSASTGAEPRSAVPSSLSQPSLLPGAVLGEEEDKKLDKVLSMPSESSTATSFRSAQPGAQAPPSEVRRLEFPEPEPSSMVTCGDRSDCAVSTPRGDVADGYPDSARGEASDAYPASVSGSPRVLDDVSAAEAPMAAAEAVQEEPLLPVPEEVKVEVKKSFQVVFEQACVRGMSPTSAAVDAIRKHGFFKQAGGNGSRRAHSTPALQDRRMRTGDCSASARRGVPLLNTMPMGSCVGMTSHELLLSETVASPASPSSGGSWV